MLATVTCLSSKSRDENPYIKGWMAKRCMLNFKDVSVSLWTRSFNRGNKK